MTFSIAGVCQRTAMAGVAITTSSISVGSRCPWARAGAGAVATQNITDPSIGNQVLDLMETGMDAASAVAKVMDQRPHTQYRQVTAVDLRGNIAQRTGDQILGRTPFHKVPIVLPQAICCPQPRCRCDDPGIWRARRPTSR